METRSDLTHAIPPSPEADRMDICSVGFQYRSVGDSLRAEGDLVTRVREWIAEHSAFVAFTILFLGMLGMFGLYVDQQRAQDALIARQLVQEDYESDLEVWSMCDRGNETRAVLREQFEANNEAGLRFINQFPISPNVKKLIDEEQIRFRARMEQLGPRECGPRPVPSKVG